MGHVFGNDGLRPSPDKVQTILNMPVPHDKPSLQRFMGMVNYVQIYSSLSRHQEASKRAAREISCVALDGKATESI